MAADYCGVTTEASIGNQVPMTVRCWLEAGHDGQHRGQTLDSDDNPIPYTWGDHAQGGAINVGVAIIVGFVGLFLLAFTRGSRTPDGRWVALVAIVGAVVLVLSTGIAGYRRRERRDVERTADVVPRLKQDTSGDHYWDA